MKRLLGLSVVLAVLLISSPAGAQAPAEYLSGFGTPTIDGVLSAGEWDDADTLNYAATLSPQEGGGTTPATLFVMNDATNLYLAVKVYRTTLGSSSAGFEFDNDHDDVWPENGDDALVLNPPAFFDDYRVDGSGPVDTSDGGTSDGAGAATNNGSFTFYEISHPLDSADDAHDFSLAPGDVVGFSHQLRFCNTTCVDTFVPGPGPGDFGDITIAQPIEQLLCPTADPACLAAVADCLADIPVGCSAALDDCLAAPDCKAALVACAADLVCSAGLQNCVATLNCVSALDDCAADTGCLAVLADCPGEPDCSTALTLCNADETCSTLLSSCPAPACLILISTPEQLLCPGADPACVTAVGNCYPTDPTCSGALLSCLAGPACSAALLSCAGDSACSAALQNCGADTTCLTALDACAADPTCLSALNGCVADTGCLAVLANCPGGPGLYGCRGRLHGDLCGCLGGMYRDL